MKNKLSKQQSSAELAAILHSNGIASDLQLVEVEKRLHYYCVTIRLSDTKLQHLKLDYDVNTLQIKGTLIRNFSLFDFSEKINVGPNYDMKLIRINQYATYISIDIPL